MEALKLVTETDILSAVESYLGLKAEAEALEARIKEVRTRLESHAKLQTDKSFQCGLLKISLIDIERENCRLKEAKAALGEALKPFISVSSYTQLRVTAGK